MLHDNSELFLFIKANEPYVCEQINDRPELDWACFGGNKMKSEMKNNNVWPVVLGEDSSLDRPLKERCIITSVSLPAPRSHKPHLVCSDFSSVHLLALLMIQWCDCWKTSQAFWMNPLVYRCVCACVCALVAVVLGRSLQHHLIRLGNGELMSLGGNWKKEQKKKQYSKTPLVWGGSNDSSRLPSCSHWQRRIIEKRGRNGTV